MVGPFSHQPPESGHIGGSPPSQTVYRFDRDFVASFVANLFRLVDAKHYQEKQIRRAIDRVHR